jgi:hypothetical protein
VGNRARLSTILTALTGLALLLTACANGPSAGSQPPTADAGAELIGQGTVIQIGDADPELCLGPIAQSYPPQCGGPTVLGWEWASAGQSETVGDVTWGTYAVFGTWDGTSFTSTKDPIPLALYDAMAIEDPRLAGSAPGSTAETELTRIQAELELPETVEALGSYVQQGYVVVEVMFDDGSVQAVVDERYGPDVVIVQSSLRPAP